MTFTKTNTQNSTKHTEHQDVTDIQEKTQVEMNGFKIFCVCHKTIIPLLPQILILRYKHIFIYFATGARSHT